MIADKHKLVIRDVRKSYGSVTAVAGVSLQVREGEFVTLLGPSGSGKTTLLTMVAGLTWPDSGEIWINGLLATFQESSKRDIGMVFQNYALFPHLTVYENIAFPLRMRRTSEAQIRRDVRWALELVQLPELMERLPSTLSGGQQQRIALARCIVYKPSIILMDEPLGALDKKLRDQMQLEIKRLHVELGITALYVTHDQEEAMVMSDRICLFKDARIEQQGTPAELYFRPNSRFAASFLGESNILDATVIGQEGERIYLRTVGDVRVNTLARDDLDITKPICFMVRPEFLSLLGDSEQADNVLPGILRDVILAGGVTKYFVEIADGSVMTATRLTARRTHRIETGSRVRMGWPGDCSVLLPSGAAPTTATAE